MTNPERSKTRVLIAEDHLIARLGIGAIINAQPDMMVIAEAEDGDQAFERYCSQQPDVTLMDMRMPVMNGTDAITAIRAEFPQARIIALSTFSGAEDVRRALAAGAWAYLTKDVLHDDLLAAIRAVRAGNRYLTPLALGVLSEHVHTDLSARELEVLELIVQGLSNKQIAYDLNIAEYTAKNHVKKILKKLEVGDRTHAATAAIQRGIVHLDR